MSDHVNEDHDARVKFALEDSIDHIFHFMKMEDLYTSAQVCRSWYREVIQAIRRRHLELNPGKSVPNLEVRDVQSPCVDLKNSDKNVTLLFARHDQEFSTYCIKVYEDMFHSKVFVVRVWDTWLYKSLLNTFNKPVLMHHLPALYLQDSENTQIRIFSCTEDEASRNRHINNVLTTMFNELIPQNNKDIKNILLLFTTSQSSDRIAEDIITIAKSKLEPKSFNIWGGRCINFSEHPIHTMDAPACLSLAISGSNVETWAHLLDCISDRSAVREALVCFKNKIKLRNHNFGLVFGPSVVEDVEVIFGYGEESYYHTVCQEYSDFTSIIESTFPEISLVGLFHDHYEYIFGNNVFNQTCSNEFASRMTVSLLIIAYD